MSTLISSLVLAVLYFSVISVSKYGNKFYWFFETAHFLGGFFVAMFLSNFFRIDLHILIGVVVVSILWELGEFIVNSSEKIQRFLIDKFNHYVIKMTVPDTLLDLFLSFVGAAVFIYLL